MNVEQYVMAYGVEHDRLRSILPDGFTSLRPVLRFNAEIRDEHTGYLEFNTAAEKDGLRGWVNIARWENIPFVREGKKVTFQNDLLELSFEGVGIEGSCPAEKDNAGCYYLDPQEHFQAAEIITANKEFCDCTFCWKMEQGAFGKSLGMTLPAYPEEAVTIYPKQEFTAANATSIPCRQVLGAYMVKFERALPVNSKEG